MVLAVLLLASSCAGTAATPSTGACDRAPTASPRAIASSARTDDWPAYQGGVRAGVLPGDAFQLAAKAWQTARLDGPIFAAPVIADGVAIVATECDTVYTFDAGDGHPLWSRRLGDPVPASSLTCPGNIMPVSGITSTPVADPASGRLYVVTFERPVRHVLHVLDLADGRQRWQQTVDPPEENPRSEQQRGALKLAGATVYVPFGGLFGDCGTYHGWVVGVRLRDRTQIGFRPPRCPNMCAIWAPGGPTIGPDGDVWVATGNSDGSVGSFDGGNAVYRLTSDLNPEDWFAPPDWRSLSSQDADLGSISPVLLPQGLAWIAGKDGTGHLLRQGRLGHVGGAVASASACPSYGAAVALGTSVLVPCWGQGGVLQIRVDTAGATFSTGWHTPMGMPGGLIVAFGAAWVIDTDNGTLYALDPGTGAVRFSLNGGEAQHFATPAAAGGKVYAAVGGRLVAVDVN